MGVAVSVIVVVDTSHSYVHSVLARGSVMVRGGGEGHP